MKDADITKHDSKEDCVEAVIQSWEETVLADSWMVAHWYVDEYNNLKLLQTHCNFKKGDLYISLAELGVLIGRENGHSEEYLDEFRKELLKFIWSTVGRQPKPEPLPLAKRMRVVDEMTNESNGDDVGED